MLDSEFVSSVKRRTAAGHAASARRLPWQPEWLGDAVPVLGAAAKDYIIEFVIIK